MECAGGDIVMEGSLSIQSSISKRWRPKLARLHRDGSLRVYEPCDQLVRQLTVIDSRLEEAGPAGFVIHTRGGGALAAQADTPRLAAVWLSELYHAAYASSGGVAFGKSLAEVMSGQVAAGGQGFVPRVVADCAERLARAVAGGELRPGQLHGNGSARVVRELRQAYQLGERVQPHGFAPNDAGSLLRGYLAELPAPVVPGPALRAELLALCQAGDWPGVSGLLSSGRLSAESRNLLRVTCGHMRGLLTAGLDSVESLAGQFAASLFAERAWRRDGEHGEHPAMAASRVGDALLTTALLVRNFDAAFSSVPLITVRKPATPPPPPTPPTPPTASSADVAVVGEASAVPAELLRLCRLRGAEVAQLRASLGRLRPLDNGPATPELPACEDCEPLSEISDILRQTLSGMLDEFEALAERNADLSNRLATGRQFNGLLGGGGGGGDR